MLCSALPWLTISSPRRTVNVDDELILQASSRKVIKMVKQRNVEKKVCIFCSIFPSSVTLLSSMDSGCLSVSFKDILLSFCTFFYNVQNRQNTRKGKINRSWLK